MKLYAPAIVLVFWAVLLEVTGCDGTLFVAAALVTLAVAVGFQACETKHRWFGHRG